MKRLPHILLLNIFWFLMFFGAQAQTAKRPNIIWISTEDMSPRLGCYGDNTVPTPNIDKLAAEGQKYTQVFTTAGVCAPSRNAIATGRIQTSNGAHNMRTTMDTFPLQTGLPKQYSVVMPVGVKHFAEYLRAEGYYCTNNAKTDYQFEDIPTIWDEVGPKAHYKNRAQNQPFFAVFNSMITHESQIWARAKNPLRVNPKTVVLPPFYPENDSIRLDVARHYSNISEMDDWVGTLTKELEQADLLENTIIMFWSDHGDGLPYIKREITDKGLRIPLIVRFPKNSNFIGQLPKGSSSNRLISAIDLPASVLSLAEIKPPANMQGKAFLGTYMASKAHKYVFAARDRMDSEYDRVRSVHDGRFQYIYNFFPERPRYQNVSFRTAQAGMREILRLNDAGQLNDIQAQWFQNKPQEEFYDVKSDPHQLNNLINDPTLRPKIEAFRQAFKTWQSEVPDLGAVDEKQLVRNMWNGEQEPPKTKEPKIQKLNKKIKISAITPGASLAYKWIENNQNEKSNWQCYSKPITVQKGKKLLVVSQRIGYLASEIVIF